MVAGVATKPRSSNPESVATLLRKQSLHEFLCQGPRAKTSCGVDMTCLAEFYQLGAPVLSELLCALDTGVLIVSASHEDGRKGKRCARNRIETINAGRQIGILGVSGRDQQRAFDRT